MSAALPGILVLWLCILAWSARTKWMVKAWSENERFTILESRWCWFSRGPFLETWVTHQSVYRLLVRDSSGKTRACWAKLGGDFLGLWANKIFVVWDAAAEDHPRRA